MDLDNKAVRVLESIYECGGRASTTDVKGFTGIETNAIVHYRFDKLEDEGLIEAEVIDDGSRTGITEAELTDEGKRRVVDILEDHDDGDVRLVEEVDQLNAAVRELGREVETLRGQIEEELDRVSRIEEIAAEAARDEVDDGLVREVAEEEAKGAAGEKLGDVDGQLVRLDNAIRSLTADLCNECSELDEDSFWRTHSAMNSGDEE